MRMKAVLASVLCMGLTAAVPVVHAAPQEGGKGGGSVIAVAGGALISYRGWLLALDDARSDVTADIRLLSASGRGQAPKVLLGKSTRDLALFAALEQVKDGTRLRLTSLPGPGAGAGAALLIEFGDGDYRMLIPASAIPATEYASLAQSFPGADLALLLQGGKRVMLPLGQGKGTQHVFGLEQAAPYRFVKIRR